MLPIVKTEVKDVVTAQFDGETLPYIQRILDKLEHEQPVLHAFFLEKGREFVKDLAEMETDEERNLYSLMCMLSTPVMLYEMLRNQEEANELNLTLS